MITPNFIEKNVKIWNRKSEIDATPDCLAPKYGQSVYLRNKLKVDFSELLLNSILDLFEKSLNKNLFLQLKTDYSQISIQKYEVGDYIPPHVDNYKWLYNLILTDSKIDGLVLEDKEHSRLHFHEDVYGNVIKVKREHLHWVNPIRDKTRYTAVILCDAEYDNIYDVPGMMRTD
jgi:hypothetical protein